MGPQRLGKPVALAVIAANANQQVMVGNFQSAAYQVATAHSTGGFRRINGVQPIQHRQRLVHIPRGRHGIEMVLGIPCSRRVR